MEQLDVNAYYALGIPAYFLLIAWEVWATRRQGLKVYGFADTICNISGGMGEIMIGFFIGPYLFWLYAWAYDHFALIRWPDHSWVPWALALFGGDFCYYLYHRAGHAVACLWAIHGVHHQAEEMNVTVAMRHPWFSDLYSVFFYAPLPLLGIPPLHFFVCIAIISFYALLVHSRVFHRPGFYLLVTPATHIVHHATNPRYLGKNLGAMFTIWDRLFGTHVELDPDDPPVLGTRRGYETHSGARSQWIFFRDLLAAARQADNWRDRFWVFFGHPGWLPPGASLPATHPPPADREIGWLTKSYVMLQYVPMALFSLMIVAQRELFSAGLVAVVAVFYFWGLATLGGMLDGSRPARRWEAARLVTGALVVCFWIA
ncbi:MAG: sterol desaturase family protein [Vulcanimicrobiota bacterium]